MTQGEKTNPVARRFAVERALDTSLATRRRKLARGLLASGIGGSGGAVTQRQLRNDSGEIMRRLDEGESFVVTRNGLYSSEWGAWALMRGGLGWVGQLTPPVWSSTRSR